MHHPTDRIAHTTAFVTPALAGKRNSSVCSPFTQTETGARFISMVRVFTHGAMGHRIDPLWWIHFSFQPVLNDWCNKGCGMIYPVCRILKNPCCYSERVAHVAAAGFLSHYLNGPLPYVRHHITVTKMC